MAFLNHNINNNNNLVVDHINNNGFDNRLENLQIITKIKKYGISKIIFGLIS